MRTSRNTNIGDYAENVKAASKIFAEYGDFIYQIARFKVRDENLAGDLVQNLFLSTVFNPIPKNIENIKSYLYKAIINDIFDQARWEKNQEKFLKKYAENAIFSINDEAAADAILNENRFAEIFKIMGDLLTSSESKAIELRYKDGCSIEKIAEIMDVKKESVSRYLSIGLKKLRQFFRTKRGELE